MPDLLLEIGTEEMPAGYIAPALEALRKGLTGLLAANGFMTAPGSGSGAAPAAGSEAPPEIAVTGTPRRLILCGFGLPGKALQSAEKVKGPPADRAFDGEGRPTKAAEGFARKHGLTVDHLAVEDGYVWARVGRGGESLDEFLRGQLPGLIGALPFPKSMRWLPGERTAFARPVRYLVCMLDGKVVPFAFAGLTAGRESRGHSFHAPEPFALRDAKWGFFREALRGRKVLADIEERRSRVRACVEKGAEKCGGRLYNRGGVSDRLVEEVTNLLEWPGAVLGSFDEQVCRELPDEVVVAAMTGHQRYFPVEDASGRLLPRFVSVANRDPRSGGKAAVIRCGNERVLRARLADALFFWRDDRKTRLESRLPRLEGVVFHEKLGSMRQKSERLAALASWLAARGGHEEAVAEAAARGALLCKCDLVTHLVFEFPELQGVMGKYYAREDGEASTVRQAIEEHYLPRAADAELPRSAVGRLVALADKFDSIVGGFAAGLAPTGSKDPYALRRAALGIVAIVRGARMFRAGPGLRAVLEESRELYRRQGLLADAGDELIGRILAFFRDRLEQVLADRTEKARSVQILRAVLAAGFDNLTDMEARLAAVDAFAGRPEFTQLCTVVERARNIVRKEPELLASRPEPQKALIAEPAEAALYDTYLGAGVKFRLHVKEGRYDEASQLYLSSFAGPLHEFFEKVFVNVDDPAVRRNRLALLANIYRMYADSVADLAECAGQARV